MENIDSVAKLAQAIKQGKSFPVVDLVKKDPATAAAISKLLKPKDPTKYFEFDRSSSYNELNQNQLQTISDSNKSRIRDSQNVTQLFPDIELAIQIIVSSVLSPKDMVKTEIIYKARENILPSEVLLKLNSIVKEHYEGHYKIKEKLSTILRDVLFTTGSYIRAVIPESAIDEIINNNSRASTESLKEIYKDNNDTVNLGILGNAEETKQKIGLESFSFNTYSTAYNSKLPSKEIGNLAEYVDISDNYKILKIPTVQETLRKNKLKSILASPTIAAENSSLNTKEFSALVYKNKNTETELLVTVPTAKNTVRKSIGRPLVLTLPTESVIPVYVPGDERKHVGYFVLVDGDGNPVTMNSNQDYVEGLSGLMSNQSQNLSSSLIQKAKKNLMSNDGHNVTLDQIFKVYSGIVENDLINRLKNGLYGSELGISNNEDVYRIMLARSFANKYTRLIYLPAELVTYFAMKYFENGVGKSLLDDLKILTSLRAILLFSKVMALAKSSINLTHVNMTLDPEDPDPQKSIEIAMHEIIKLRQQYFPLGINSPSDLVDWIQRVGLEFSFEGHPGLPETKFDFEVKNLQHTVPDSDLDELLRKQTYMAMGLSPETIDNGFNSEFATTVVSNNILLAKRILKIQEDFIIHLTSDCCKIINNDVIIIKELKEALNESIGLIETSLTDEEKESLTQDKNKFLADLVDRYVNNISLEFPKPDEVSLETQSAAFDQYAEAIEKAVDCWISTDVVPSDLAGDINGNIDSIKTVLVAYFKRQWMANNNYLPELADIVNTSEDGKPVLNLYELVKAHLDGLVRTSVDLISKLKDLRTAANTDLSNLGTEPSESDNSYDDSSSDSGGDDNFGGDDFGMDDTDSDTEEESSDEEANAKEEEATDEDTAKEGEEETE